MYLYPWIQEISFHEGMSENKAFHERMSENKQSEALWTYQQGELVYILFDFCFKIVNVWKFTKIPCWKFRKNDLIYAQVLAWGLVHCYEFTYETMYLYPWIQEFHFTSERVKKSSNTSSIWMFARQWIFSSWCSSRHWCSAYWHWLALALTIWVWVLLWRITLWVPGTGQLANFRLSGNLPMISVRTREQQLQESAPE